MSVWNGPNEGDWSVFAMKVVEQRDEAQQDLYEARKELAALKAERDRLRSDLSEADLAFAREAGAAQERSEIREQIFRMIVAADPDVDTTSLMRRIRGLIGEREAIAKVKAECKVFEPWGTDEAE